MNSDIPKQFHLLHGKPVLMHSIEAFYHSDLKPKIILSLNSEYLSLWAELCISHHFEIPLTIVNNGAERFHSVKNGLAQVDGDSIVAVHDAVRPVISNELITRCFKLTEEVGAVIPVVASRDSVRKKEGKTTTALKREDILLVQTPQVFQSSLLKQAYNQQYSVDFTDDASVVEKAGFNITTTQGDYRNLKITYPDDLKLAEIFLDKT